MKKERYTLFADLHFRQDSTRYISGKTTLQYCCETLQYILEHSAKIGSTLLFAGDFFDNRKGLSAPVINMAIHTLLSKLNSDFYGIAGNHDMASQVCAADLEGLEDRTVYMNNNYLTFLERVLGANGAGRDTGFNLVGANTRYEEIGNTVFAFVPYMTYPNEFYSKVHEVAIDIEKVYPNKTLHKNRILITHACVMGYKDIRGNIDPTHECFAGFDYIISGDIHTHKWITDKWLMLGAPMQKNIGDIDMEPVFWDMEIAENGEVSFEKHVLPTAVSPRFSTNTSDLDENSPILDSLSAAEEHAQESETPTVQYLGQSPETMITQYLQSIGMAEKHGVIGNTILQRTDNS